MFRKPMNEIEAIDRELIRMHELLLSTSYLPETVRDIYANIKMLTSTLNEMARKNNGLDNPDAASAAKPS